MVIILYVVMVDVGFQTGNNLTPNYNKTAKHKQNEFICYILPFLSNEN